MAKKSPHLLTDLTVEEVSSVDAGANGGARVILTKSESDIMEKKERISLVAKLAEYLNIGKKEGDTLVIKTDEKEDEHVDKDLENLQKTVDSQGFYIRKLEAKDSISNVMKVATDAIAKADDASTIDSILAKVVTDVSTIVKEKEIDDATLVKSFDADIENNLTEHANARKAEITKASDNDDMKRFRSRLLPGMQRAFDDMDEKDRSRFMTNFSKFGDVDPIAKAVDDLTQHNEQLQKRLDKMESESEITKAKEEFKDLESFVKIDDFVGTAVKMRKLAPDAAIQFIEQTRAMKKQSEDGNIFKILGRPGQAVNDASSAIDKAAEQLMVADASITKEQAVTKAMEINPQLYSDHEAEQVG